MLRRDHRRLRESLLKCGQDLDPLDRIDAQVGIESHGQFEHLLGISGLLGHDREERGGDVPGNVLLGRGAELDGCGQLGRRLRRCLLHRSRLGRRPRGQQSLLAGDGLDGPFLGLEELAVHLSGLFLKPDQRLKACVARAHGLGQQLGSRR